MTCIGNMVAEINSEHTGDLSTVLNESYLTYIKSPPLRIALCRFHISCHSLEIERADIMGPNHYLQIRGSGQAANNWAENWLKTKYTF